MKKAIVKLSDGTIYEYQSPYIWSFEDKLNDVKNDFIEIGKLVVKKSNIYSIEIIEISEENEEVETNE